MIVCVCAFAFFWFNSVCQNGMLKVLSFILMLADGIFLMQLLECIIVAVCCTIKFFCDTS